MFELSNIKITKSKVDEKSIESNGFWFTPVNGEFNTDGVAEFITSELESPKWLDGKTFPSLNHLFVTESQTNLFMALCPSVVIDGYSFELKYNRILGGHQLHAIKVEGEDIEEEQTETEKVEEVTETAEDVKETVEESAEDAKEVEEKSEDKVEEPKEKKTTARKSTKK
jgi:hypothetical protein|nr:MAG TPA: hypothetical protein [Ackermannviridae sp.]